MAVLIEANSLVIPVAILEERFEGGLEGFLSFVPSGRYCRDEHLVAVHYRYNIGDLAPHLRLAGLAGPRDGHWKDMAIVCRETASTIFPCDWLLVGGNSDGVVFAALDGHDLNPHEISVPTAWALEPYVNGDVKHKTLDQYDERFEFVRSDDTSDIYQNLETGHEIRAARTRSTPESLPPTRTPNGPGADQENSLEVGDHRNGTGVKYRQTVELPSESDGAAENIKLMFDKKDSEIVEVMMGFADYHELDEGTEEGEYLEDLVSATQVAPNRYRLEENPMLTEMATFHDVVEGEVDEHGVFYVQRVVEESGLKTIRKGFPRMFYFSDFGRAFLDRIEAAGGSWVLHFWGEFVYNVPGERVGEFEEQFKIACKEARLLEKDELRLPKQLLRQRPMGGNVSREEEN